MLTLVAVPIGALLKWLYGLIHGYGLAIIALTLIVRLCLLPLYAKQISYQAKTSSVQPKLKEIQVKYANDRDMMNQKIMELYQQEGISPSSGCLPLLIQMPIIMGLFALLRSPLTYMTSTEMIAAVHESFLWINDLCQPDSLILPILAGVSTYFTYSASSNASPETAGMMNGMKYFFPLFIFLLGRTYPAGLALYWAVGNVFTIFQTIFLNKQKEKQNLRDEVIAEKKQSRKAAREQAKNNK
ncbi:MAG: YidC/Oxa1 family membrane protein insertase [Clostridia bacterium]|nr:YidC/Oxa1 family membrane protein insertase [Clostridia bacterium]